MRAFNADEFRRTNKTIAGVFRLASHVGVRSVLSSFIINQLLRAAHCSYETGSPNARLAFVKRVAQYRYFFSAAEQKGKYADAADNADYVIT